MRECVSVLESACKGALLLKVLTNLFWLDHFRILILILTHVMRNHTKMHAFKEGGILNNYILARKLSQVHARAG